MTTVSTNAGPLATLRTLIDSTKDLDYDPSQEGWVCGNHGIPECGMGTCADLPWPEPNASPLLSAFTLWADAEFARIVRPYDLSDDPDKQMPDDAFRSYSLFEWPLGDVLDALSNEARA